MMAPAATMARLVAQGKLAHRHATRRVSLGAWGPYATASGRRLHATRWLVLSMLLAAHDGCLVAQPSRPDLTSPLPASASTIYRCPDGQYRDVPCPGGRELATDPAPSAAQRAQARDAAAKQARLAADLRTERQAKEREAAGRGPIRIGPEPVAKSASKKSSSAASGTAERKKDARKKNGKRKVGPTRLDHEPATRDAIGRPEQP